MRISSHSTACAKAVVTTPEQCRCGCAGAFHGGPHTHRARALLISPGERTSYSQRQVRDAKKKARAALTRGRTTSSSSLCTDFLGFSVIDQLISWDTSGEYQRQATDIIALTVKLFTGTLANSSAGRAGKEFIRDSMIRWHVLCPLCVEVLKVIETLEQNNDELIHTLVQRVWDSLPIAGTLAEGPDSPLSETIKEALSEATRPLIDSLIGTPELKTMVQLLGLITCPNIDCHQDVVQYCLEPLEDIWVNQALIQWVNQGFPQSDPVLAGRSR